MDLFNQYELKELFLKMAIVFGAVIVVYGVLWLLANLKIIPAIIASIFPQIVIIIIGLFIIYTAIDRKNKYF